MVKFTCNHCERETATNHYMRLEYTNEDGEEVTKDLWECDDCQPLSSRMKRLILHQKAEWRRREEEWIPSTEPPVYDEPDYDPEELYG